MADSKPASISDAPPFELTRPQRLMWAGQQLHPGVPLYNQAFLFTVEGALDPGRVAAAFECLVAECDALRLVIEEGEDGEPRQRVLPEIEVPLEIVDLTASDEVAFSELQAAEERSRQPFALDRKTFDAALYKLAEDRWQIYLCQHHVATDAWSMANLFRRWQALYRAEDSRGEEESAALSSWRQHATKPRKTPRKADEHWASFDGRPPKLYGRPLPTGTASERLGVPLNSHVSRALRRLAGRPEVGALTAEMGLFNVFAALLFAFQYRVTGERGLTLGAPAHNRGTASERAAAGLFTEVFPLRLEIDDGETWKSLLTKVRSASLAFLRHALPGTSRASASRSVAAVLNVIRADFGDFAGHPVEVRWLHPGHHDREHPLRLHVHAFDVGDRGEGDLTLLFDLNHELAAPGERRVVGHVMRLLDAMLEDLEQPIDEAPMLGDEERELLLEQASGGPPAHDGESTVLDAFDEQVRRRPDACAVRLGGAANAGTKSHALSYAELDARSRQLAEELRRHGIEDGRVAYLAERTPGAVVAMLGILRAGAAYVPVDPSWPEERVKWLLEDAGARAVVVPQGVDGVVTAGGLPVIELDSPPGPPERSPSRPEIRSRAPTAETTAYVLYTSGSTGKPKGVVIRHGALANYVTWAAGHYGKYHRSVSMPLFSPLTFDLTVTSIFVPLVTGGEIVVYPETARQADLALLDVVREDAVDVLKLTPSHLQLLEGRRLRRDQEQVREKPRLRQLIFGGEALHAETARRARALLGPAVTLDAAFLDEASDELIIHNEYGPTEATVGCVVHTFDAEKDGGAVPIGRPIAGMRAYVLDHRMQAVPEGTPGELVLGGVGLAEGYLGRPELDAESFVTEQAMSGGESERLYRTGDRVRLGAGGRLEYLGRRDEQVKVRGARIELGEIEAALAEHAAVASCAVGVEKPRRKEQRAASAGDVVTGTLLPAGSLAAASLAAGSFKESAAASSAQPDAELRHCVRCGLASNHPHAALDAAGVCAECLAFEKYRHKVDDYFRGEDELRAILGRGKRQDESGYDCLALLSGGKDSTYVLCRLVDMGYRVFAFTLDNGYISEQAKGNIRRVVAELGVEHVFGETPHMKQIFAESLERFSNVCQGCFKTIYTLAVKEAEARRIPFIVTGLSRGQLFETRLTRELFTELDFEPERIDEAVLEARKAYHRQRDAVSRHLDVSLFEDDAIFERVRFVDFFRYSNVELEQMYAELDRRVPWVRPTDTGRSTNCLINDVGIYVHKRERGFHNYALPYAWDVRMGHKKRDEALEELDDEIDVERVEKILGEVGYVTESRDAARLVAYVAPSDETDRPEGGELREFLRSKLPDFMLPAAFVVLKEMPLTAHGKVDRQALEKRALEASAESLEQDERVEPEGELERALAELFAQVLRLPTVSVTANFFELGGDSIQAIQLVARARSRGLVFAPEDLFDALTVRSLASLVRQEAADRPAEPEPEDGPTPLLPAQAFYFAFYVTFYSAFYSGEANVERRWHHVLELEVSDSFDTAAFEAALDALPRHHEALRQLFAPLGDPGEWRVEQARELKPVLLRERIGDAASRAGASPAPTPEAGDAWIEGREAAESELIDEVGRRFVTGEAPLLAARWVDGEGGRRLLMVAHHLVVDAVSWSILLLDLETLARGGVPEAATTSPGAWARARARSSKNDLDFWRTMLEQGGGRLPSLADGAVADESETAKITSTLDESTTRRLLEDVAKAGRLTPHEVLVAAFAQTLAEWRGEGDVAFFLEGHGRDAPPGVSVDASRLVGWLTSLYPLALALPGDDDALIRDVRRRLREVPAGGASYGALRHGGDASMRAELSSLEGHDALFNYLGRAERLGTESLRTAEPLRLVRDGQPFALEVDALVWQGRLEVSWSFRQARFERGEIEKRAERFAAHLGRLVEATCRTQPARAEDFPLAKLDEKKFAKLGALLDKGSN